MTVHTWLENAAIRKGNSYDVMVHTAWGTVWHRTPTNTPEWDYALVATSA